MYRFPCNSPPQLNIKSVFSHIMRLEEEEEGENKKSELDINSIHLSLHTSSDTNDVRPISSLASKP